MQFSHTRRTARQCGHVGGCECMTETESECESGDGGEWERERESNLGEA